MTLHKIYTIGHSNRSMNEFMNILEKYGVKCLIDVRRFPSSRKYPWFRRETLNIVTRRSGITYIWLGDKLGGFRSGGYEKYMETEDFMEGINYLIDLLEKFGVIAIMCKERLWFKCHRRFISDILYSKGYEVIHIIDNNRIYKHKRGEGSK